MAEENHVAQRQTAVTVYLERKQLLLFAFARRSVCQYSMAEENPAAQRQTAVTAYLKSKQLLLFVFAWRSVCQYSMAEENPAAQRQTAITVYLERNQLLLFSLLGGQYANTRWLKRILQLKETNISKVAVVTAWKRSSHWRLHLHKETRRTAVTAYLKSNQLLRFISAVHDWLVNKRSRWTGKQWRTQRRKRSRRHVQNDWWLGMTNRSIPVVLPPPPLGCVDIMQECLMLPDWLARQPEVY